jgi:hypothetical protein
MLRRLSPVLLVIVIFLVFLGWQFIGVSRSPGADPVEDHASTRTNACGTKALRELCGAMGLSAHTWGRPFGELHGRVGLLLVLDPNAGMRAGEMDALLKWVEDGGRVIIAVDPKPDRTIQGAVQPVQPWLQALAPLGLSYDATWTFDAHLLAVSPGSPLAEDARTVNMPETRGLKRLRSTSDLDLPAVVNERTEKAKALVQIRKHEQWAEYVAQGNNPVVVSFRQGLGVIYVIANVDMLDNSHLREADNAVFAANMIFTAARSPEIYFDEFHHGRVAHEAEDGGFDTSPMSNTIWAMMVVFFIYAVGKAWRFGRPEPLPPANRRSVLEYAEAYAGLYRRAHKASAALDIVAARFRRRIGSFTGLGPDAPAEQLAEAVAARRRVNRADLTALLQRIEACRGGKDITDGELLSVSRAIAAYEEVIFPHV